MGQEESANCIFEASKNGDIHGVKHAIEKGEDLNKNKNFLLYDMYFLIFRSDSSFNCN